MTIAHGCLQAFLAVVAGAFGAHGLRGVLSDYSLGVWQTGFTYHLAHAIALVMLGIFERQSGAPVRVSRWAFGLGIFFFAGSLYALAISDVRALGAITPIGGLMFLTGWLGFAYAGWKRG